MYLGASLNRTIRIAALAAALIWIAVAGLRPAAYASCGGTTIVDTEAELNAAITDFNGQTATCDYEIEFGATIALSADLNVINNTDTDVSLLIDGAGFILDGDDLYDLINVQQTIDVTIDRLTVTRAGGDGVIATDSNLRVSRSTVIDNGSDGIDTNDSSLVLIDSTVTDNNGDGVDVTGTNGLFTPAHVIINSTIVDNSFRGIVVFETDVLLTNVTIYDNESGLALSGTSNGTVNNSILGRQTNDCLVGTGTIDINHSLIEDSTTACGATDGLDGNIVGQGAVLGELGDYGGPTETMPPLAVTGCTTITSPAIDAGDDALAEDEDGNPLAFDQRGTGFPRIVDDVDMGAVEGPVAFVCPDLPPNAVTNETELNQAIADFNAYNGLDVYEIEFGFNITLTADLTVINNTNPGVSLLIDGAGFILDGDDLHNLINIQQTADVTIDRLTVTRATDDAIVANDSNLRVSRSTIIDNGSDGIDTGDSTLVLIDSTVTENSGDGVDVTGTNGLFTPAHVIINSTIADNAFRGIVAFGADILLTNVTVYDNQSGLVLSGTSNATVNNSILGQHLSDCLVDAGTADFNFSLIEDSATACGATDSVDGNIVGQSAALGTLGDNGGPTETIPPLSDTSPPVDAGDNSLAVDENGDPLAGDQRGFEPRNFNGTPDMGAYEVGATEPAASVFFSTTTAGTTGDGLAFGSEDIIQWDGTEWSMWFDGSDAGLATTGKARHNINAFWIPDPNGDDVVMSFTQNRRRVPGIGHPVDGMDLVWWDGAAFSLYFDGSDVGLANKTQEKIDALHVLPGSESPVGAGCIHYLLISTQGPGRVTNGPDPGFKFGGEDVLGFCMTNAGADTAGVWHLLLDGSAEGMPRNATDSISFSDDGETMYLTTKGTFNVDAAAGGHSMVYEYDFGTGDFSGPFFDAPAEGLPVKVDGLQVDGDLD